MDVLLGPRLVEASGRGLMLRRLAPWLWLAYVIVPARGWGFLGGRPLGLAATIVAAAVCWVWWTRGSLPHGRLIAIAVIAKIAIGIAPPAPRGFDARYYANADFAGVPEASTEPSTDRMVTRVDDRLEFGPERDRDLPVDFLNDVNRFNFYLPNQPDRATLPVSVSWEGQLRVTSAGLQRFYARSAGARIAIAVGDLSAEIPASVQAWSASTNLSAGFHRLAIRAAFPQGIARRFEAGRIVGGREEPFDTTTVFRAPVSPSRHAVDRLVRAGSIAVDLLLSLWLVAQVAQVAAALRRSRMALRTGFSARDAIAIVSAIAIADALIFALPVLGRVVVLSGGDDWLTYETMARDILLNGPWMAGGVALGHGRPFYYQPFYSYFLAACHWVFGDGLFGVYFVQRLLAAAAVVAMWRTTALLFGERVGGAGLLVAIVVVYEKFGSRSGLLLTETLFVPLVCIWTFLLVRLVAERSVGWRLPVLAGVVGGVATLTRSTLMLGWVVALPALAAAVPRARRWPALTALLLTMMGVVSLATIRNWVVARELVPIASSGSVNLFIGNEPKVKPVMPPSHKAQYERLGFDAYTQMVAEYARQRPGAVLDGLRRKAMYTLGFFDSLMPGAGQSRFYPVVWGLALAGLFLIPSVGRRESAWAVAIPLLVAATHFAAVVAIFPNVYGDRLIVPVYVLIVPYVAVALVAGVRVVARTGIEGAAAALFAVAVVAGAWTIAPARMNLDFPGVVMVIAVAAAVLADGDASWPVMWPAAAFAVALAASLVVAPSAEATSEFRQQLAFVALVPAVASLSRSERARTMTIAVVLLALSAGAAVSHASWLPSAAEWLRAIGRVPVAVRIGALAVTAAALLSALLTARRSTWLAIGALVAGAGLTIANLQRFAARTALESVTMYVDGWQAAAVSFNSHPWLGAGLAASSHDAARLRAGGAVLWFAISAGLAGVLAYLVIWIRGLWTTGTRVADWRSAAMHGILLGAFVASQDDNVVAGSAAVPAVLFVTGIVLGLSESIHVRAVRTGPFPS